MSLELYHLSTEDSGRGGGGGIGGVVGEVSWGREGGKELDFLGMGV